MSLIETGIILCKDQSDTLYSTLSNDCYTIGFLDTSTPSCRIVSFIEVNTDAIQTEDELKVGDTYDAIFEKLSDTPNEDESWSTDDDRELIVFIRWEESTTENNSYGYRLSYYLENGVIQSWAVGVIAAD